MHQRLDALREIRQIDFGAAAGRARDDLGSARAQAATFEDGDPRADLLLRRPGQADADGVADPLQKQRADAAGGFHHAPVRRPGLGDAEVQRQLGAVGEEAVGGDGRSHIRRLERGLDVIHATLLERLALAERPFGERARQCGSAVAALGEFGLERGGTDAARVRPHADRGPAFGENGGEAVELPAVDGEEPRIDADRGRARLDGGDGGLPVELDVRDKRQRSRLHEFAERGNVGVGVDGEAHDLRPGAPQ